MPQTDWLKEPSSAQLHAKLCVRLDRERRGLAGSHQQLGSLHQRELTVNRCYLIQSLQRLLYQIGGKGS